MERTFGDAVWAGSEPYVSVVTPDGRCLYVLVFSARTVKRYRLPELQFDIEFPIFTDNGIPIEATALLNPPGAPSTTIAVERADFNLILYAAGVAIYDDGVPRSKTTNGNIPRLEFGAYTNSTQFSASGDYLFGIDNQDTNFVFSL